MAGNNPNDPNFVRNATRVQSQSSGVGGTTYAPPGRTDTTSHPVGAHVTLPNGGGTSMMDPSQVRSMQQFLSNHGFQVAQDGIMGPETKSAAAAFRANHKGGDAWNKAHGIGVHPGVADTVPGGRGPGGGSAGTVGGTGGSVGVTPAPGSGAMTQLLQSLLAGGGNVGSGYDVKSFGDAAAAPDVAAAQALSRQIGANPKQEAQNQADISQWYGLDPTADSYKLSVLGRLAQARAGDAQATTDVQGNMGDLAKSLAGSIGGSANDGSGSVLAAGANAAGTVGALGQAQSDYASNIDPLLRAEAVGAGSREKGANSQALMDLQDKLAATQGQAKSDRAQGVMSAVDKNNALDQQRFANKGNLLSLGTAMQAADPNSTALKDALTAARINNTNAKTNQILSGKTGSGRAYKIDIGKATQGVIQQLGYTVSPGGQPIVPTNDHIRLATTIGAFLRSQGFRPGDGQFKKIGDTMLASFVDQHGRPIQPGAGWQV